MSPRPRIVFNALPLDPRGGGVSTYIREVLAALTPVIDADLVAAVRPVGRPELPAGITPLVLAESHGARRALAGARGFGPADLVHGLDVDLPVRRRGWRVATVHDLAVFDVPWAFPRHRAVGEQLLVRSSLRRADAIIAVSAFTAERVRELTGRDAVVVHEAPSPEMAPATDSEIERVRSRYALPDRFVLHVGNIEPRKDLHTLAEACRQVGVPLVVTGHGLWATSAPDAVTEIGHVPTGDLPALYGAATLVGYASRYEGFGLPPVEAMACGAPVVSTPVPAVAEVVGSGAATFTPVTWPGWPRPCGDSSATRMAGPRWPSAAAPRWPGSPGSAPPGPRRTCTGRSVSGSDTGRGHLQLPRTPADAHGHGRTGARAAPGWGRDPHP